MKSVIYARVSSKEQEQEGYSISAQLKFLMEYASKNGLQIAKEFIDVETAKKAGRANFNAMLAYLKENPEIKDILVEKTDRLLRNIADYATIEKLMASSDITLHLVKENVSLHKDSRSNEKFIFGIKALMAKNYIDNLSEETKKGQREKARQGIFPSLAPVGYLNYTDENGRKNIKTDEKTAPFIKRMFELYATGNYSIATLRKQILDEGFVYRGGKNFYKSVVEKILKNEFYTGVYYWAGEKCLNASHKPIIDRDLFLRVQEILKSPNKTKIRKHLFHYSGIIKCAKCGCALTAQRQKEKYIYYHCTGHRGNCHTPYLNQDEIDEKFSKELEDIHLPEQEVNDIYMGLKESLRDKMDYHNKAVEQIERQIKVLQTRIDKAYIDKIDGKISEEFWGNQTKNWVSEKENLTLRLLAHQKSDANYLQNADIILRLANKARDLFLAQEPEYKRKLVNLLVSNSTFDGKNLCFTYHKPIESILNYKQTRNWGG